MRISCCVLYHVRMCLCPHPTDVLLGFLAYQFPIHICLICPEEGSIESAFSIGDLLLELAACVHEIVSLFPQELVKEMERVELQWEPLGKLLSFI